MPKILTGKIVSLKTADTAVVKISSFRRHPVYKKRIRKDKKIKVALFGMTVKLGDSVKIFKIRPVSKEKHFKVLEVVKK